MKNLAVICIVLALLNSFMAAGYVYSNRFRGMPESDPLQSEAFVNSFLPIDSFVLPGQGSTGMINMLIKTNLPVLIFARPATILSFQLSTEIIQIPYYIERMSLTLSLIRTSILRI